MKKILGLDLGVGSIGWSVISIDENGDVYISMLAWENGNGGGNNYGPIAMKYVAKNWVVNDK